MHLHIVMRNALLSQVSCIKNILLQALRGFWKKTLNGEYQSMATLRQTAHRSVLALRRHTIPQHPVHRALIHR